MFRRSSRFGGYRKRAAKSNTEKDPLKFYSIFNPHDMIAPVYPKKEKWIQVCSIDPGIKNFALRVERWHPNGKTEMIDFSHTDFTLPNDKIISKIGEENFYYINAINLIEEMCIESLQDCQYICIESQLSFAYDNVRISSHIICALCTFLRNKGNRPLILEIDPKLKSRLLGAPSMKNKNDLKKWSVNKACEFFAEEGDIISLEFMKELGKSRKADDIGDAKCQLEALRILHQSKTLPKIHTRPTFIIKNNVTEKKAKILIKK